ncbi:MAG: AAA family ATPase [Faecalimonas umbilicata]|uniref:AAA family ATPase n=1 Tax=Faecalimonas umbilicata TaxID=1912855 RepID=UPI002431137C|nr:AAA family ATPase [Faecalimonas umbilicata]MCI5987106.1 AAA family ATPase [Faecalimonas umbilicata]MDY4669710.1 AAA family ATPase [Oliverpabstia sp.]MDY5093269.1 AAA family ATPase [Faecalimonas umbilicata]
MSTYLARIEHVNEFYNIRPVMEMLDDGFVEVDESKFGQYGTITIAAIYGQYSESPLIQDDKYVMFKLNDSELASLEKTYNGYRIKASDYITRAKALDTYRIREVIDIPTEYNFETYYEWKKEMITDIMQPITSVVYLSNQSQIIGPFCWKELSGNGYQFLPYAEGDDAYVVNAYDINDFEEPIYEFDAAKRPSDLYYERVRHILLVNSLPQANGNVDCIDDESLKDLASKILATSAETRKAQKEIRNAVMGLTNLELTEERKQRLINMFKNEEITDQMISTIPPVILENPDSMEKIAETLLKNSNYSEKIYSLVKEQGGFSNIFSKLESDKKEKQAELADLQRKVEQTKNQISEDQTVDNEKVQHLVAENENLKSKIDEYGQYESLLGKVGELKNRKEELEGEYNQLLKMKDSVANDIEKKVSEAYTNLAFDGALSSMMMEEAAKFEKNRKNENVVKTVATKEKVKNISTITNPRELVDFVYDELNVKAKRNISRNDVANIMLCFSQGFLSILVGEPGSGKTSLVSLIAQILGLNNSQYNRYEEVAVEKGWTSRRDLIGYYNPLTKTFDAANKGMFNALEIMKAESQAKITDFPYLILLDEANLSQMEHYWADFMSLCDFDKKRREVSLGEDYTYPIPNTLRFIATINLDHTTEILSPRLIDRAWIIKLQASDVLIDELTEVDVLDEYPLVTFDCFAKLNASEQWVSSSLDIAIVEKFNRIRTCFQEVGINFSPRIIGMIKRYCLASKSIMDSQENVYVALDYAVAQKILPLINGYGETYAEFLQKLLLECDQNTMPRCYELIQAILKKGNLNMQYYQFFAR